MKANQAVDDTFHQFFSEQGSGKFIPRSIFVDLEEGVINEVRTGARRQLYHPSDLLSGKDDAAGNFSRGHYGQPGQDMIEHCLNSIKRVADNCTDLQGFLIYNSMGGGTGSGFGSLLLERLSEDYSKKTKLTIPVFPRPLLSSSVMEPYNSILAMSYLGKHSDVVVPLDNNAIYDIC